ncbi:hypothetical protein [Streptomyces alanosinicus]|uniref:hypothetical protein n=1 Tax=Streptomyces alanosinicus TaxID=68171 RepID=UPI0016782FF6|nr:hypothetical protein [Streptomyces alanosinicus]
MEHRLGLLCDQLTRHETMAAEIETAGAGTELGELLALIGRGPGSAADPERAAQLLDAIEDACARNSLSPLAVRDHTDSRLPGGFGLRPEGRAWVCPMGACDRVVLPEEANERPRCASGEPLRPYPPL